jgi:hypothetical protein
MKERSKNQDVSSMRLVEDDAVPQLSDRSALLAILAVILVLWAALWIAVGMFGL